MPNQIEKYYSSFAGVDTRSNKLLQDPKTFRKGSKNFRYNFQDEIQKAQGFQHKDNGAPNFVDQFEYKYRDVNTGQALTQLLGVATDGNLYKRVNHWLKFVSHGVATSVSMIYDEDYDTYKMILTGIGEVTISKTMQLATGTTSGLVGALNALGVTTKIVDDSGADVATSSKLAYLLDCVVEDTTFADNAVYFWEVIPFPNASSVPFPVTVSYNTSSDYEGISSVNLNNSIYMTDGGFPMKYDGKCIYRVGMPNVLAPLGTGSSNFSGISITGVTTTGGSLTLLATYGYKFRYGFINSDGAEFLGEPDGNQVSGLNYISKTLTGTQNAISIAYKGLQNGLDFPIFSATISSNQNIGNTGGTFNVSSGHNIVAGMTLRIPVSNNLLGDVGYSYLLARVSSTTATSITVEKGITSGVYPFTSGATTLLVTNQILNGYFLNPDVTNKITDVYPTGRQYHPPTTVGAFLRVYRTKANTAATGPYYELIDLPLPLGSSSTTFIDTEADTNLITIFNDGDGGQIPRACKYLTAWQGQLVQAGRPPQETSFFNDFYPSYGSSTAPVGSWGTSGFIVNYLYTEANLCDLQSIYYADSLTPEGFPQDGLHEYSIDTKFADRIKAVAPNKDALFVLKERSTAILSGALATNSVVIEILEADCGCVSHKTVEDVRGYLIWLDKINGFFSCVAGRLPENIGFPIQDYQKINSLKLDYSKASAANFRKESLYVCSVNNTTFVFDYADNGNLKRNCWYIWDRIIGKSVFATSDDKLLVWDGTKTWKMKLTGTKYDFTDDVEAIYMILNTAWLSQGFPSIDKHYIGLWINSIQGDFTLSVNQYGNFLEDLIGTQSNVQFIAESSSKKFVKAQIKAAIPKLSSISFGIENDEKNKAVKIQGYELQYSADFNSGEPKR